MIRTTRWPGLAGSIHLYSIQTGSMNPNPPLCVSRLLLSTLIAREACSTGVG